MTTSRYAHRLAALCALGLLSTLPAAAATPDWRETVRAFAAEHF